jgi:hypothetical protein
MIGACAKITVPPAESPPVASPETQTPAPAPVQKISLEEGKSLLAEFVLVDETEAPAHPSFEKLNTLSVDDKKALFTWYIDSFVQQAKPIDSELEKKYRNFLLAIEHVFQEGQLNQYIDSRGYWLPNGLKFFISEIGKRDKYSKVFSDLPIIPYDQLVPFVDNLVDSNFQGVKRGIVYSGVHFTPIFLSFQKKEKRIVLTDSIGMVPNGADYITPILNLLNQSKLTDTQVYAPSFFRQIDHQSCPVFSLVDLKESSRFDLFGYVRKLETQHPDQIVARDGLSNPSNQFYLIGRLPPAMMRTSQTSSGVKRYLGLDAEDATAIIGKHGTLQQTIDLHLLPFDATGKTTNFYARKKFFEKVSLIVHHLFQ